ncbi:MAG TPA: sphingomyelin phosphodiesterase, partial [Aquella sp.]|nr:sphingomyelin phosphodiesterase [Aquella sp.]
MFKYLAKPLIILMFFSVGVSFAEETKETNVFFTNNTLDRITVEYDQKSDPNTSTPVWTSGPVSIPYGSSVILMKVPHKNMPPNSKLYFYATMTMTERPEEWPKKLEKKFGAGLMIQTSDEHGTSKPNLISATSFTDSYAGIKSWDTADGASTFSTSDVIGSRTYALDFHWKDNMDIEYTLRETGVSTDSKELTILQYNIQQRPIPGEGLDYNLTLIHSLRSKLSTYYLPPAIKQFDADVVTVNEAFTAALRPLLVAEMKKIGYPYSTRVLGDKGGALWSGGVMVFSKYQFIIKAEHLFTNYASDDKNADKGVLYVQINKNGKMKYNIFATHTNASYDFKGRTRLPTEDEGRIARSGTYEGPEEDKQSGQFKEIREFIKSKNIPSTEPVIIVGDLNVDMLSEKNQDHSEYTQMLNILHAVHPQITGIPYTLNSEANEWASSDDGPKQYLDYALYSKDHLIPKFSFNQAICLKSDRRYYNADKCSKSKNEIKKSLEKSRRDLSDHFPV